MDGGAIKVAIWSASVKGERSGGGEGNSGKGKGGGEGDGGGCHSASNSFNRCCNFIRSAGERRSAKVKRKLMRAHSKACSW
jgi:hypothetical protein